MLPERALFVLWREPTDDGRRHVVGKLTHDGRSFAFSYLPTVHEALARGFMPLLEFPDVDKPGAPSPHLFATFAQRIPSPARPDFKRLMSSWGVERADDKMEILAKSGGMQLTDRIELAEYRPEDDELTHALEFRVAGGKHRGVVHRVSDGEAVVLKREPENSADPEAVRVETRGGGHLGYVPRQYARLVSRLLTSGASLEAKVVRSVVEPDAASTRAVVLVARSGHT